MGKPSENNGDEFLESVDAAPFLLRLSSDNRPNQ
jgi:hypothetical protein